MRRVLVVTNMYPPHHYGGYELNCREMVSALRATGCEVLVLTSDIRVPGVDVPLEDRSDVRRALRLYWDDHVILRPSPAGCLAIERANQAALGTALHEFRPDVVSVWHMGSVSMGLLRTLHERNVPVVHVVNDDWLVYGPIVDRWVWLWRHAGPLARLGERLLHVPCRLADLGAHGVFCFVSDATRRTAEEHGGWRFRDVTVGYCGVNIDDFAIDAIAPRTEWSWRLLHVGRIDDRKGIDGVIRALALLPEVATLEVVGRGDETHLDQLRTLALELGVDHRIVFTTAERSDLAARYGAADVFVFTPRWAEPFGLVPLEAMACSTPVVATATGGSREFLVDGVNCVEVPVDDPAAIAAAVQRLAHGPALRERLVHGGRATASELTLPRWLDLLITWHVAAADRFARGRPAHREKIEQVLARVLAGPRLMGVPAGLGGLGGSR